MSDTFARAFTEIEHALDAEINTRICPTCVDGEVQLSGGHDPYTGERCYIDTCPDCDGTGEITVAPVEEADIAEIPADDTMRGKGFATAAVVRPNAHSPALGNATADPSHQTDNSLYRASLHLTRSFDVGSMMRSSLLYSAGVELRKAGYRQWAEIAECAADRLGGDDTDMRQLLFEVDAEISRQRHATP